jgi:uncharacterized membrane protein YgdD (TMEM256/DUF423 family)
VIQILIAMLLCCDARPAAWCGQAWFPPGAGFRSIFQEIISNYSPMARIFLALGAVNAFLCVGLGAFGAHGLKQKLTPDMLAVYQTGVQYHFYHALGLLAVGLILMHFPASRPIRWSGWLMLAGIVLFSLSLYVLSLTGIRGLGAITPFGGVSFLSAWALLAYGAWASK